MRSIPQLALIVGVAALAFSLWPLLPEEPMRVQTQVTYQVTFEQVAFPYPLHATMVDTVWQVDIEALPVDSGWVMDKIIDTKLIE